MDRRGVTRRAFLGGLAAGLGACRGAGPGRPEEGSLIESVEAIPVAYPVRGRFKFFEPRPGEPPVRPSVVVRLRTRDGGVGWGQSVPTHRWSYETLESVTTTIERYLAPVLLGRDPEDLEGAHAAMDRAIAPGFSTGMPIAKAGIDLALHDLLGRRSGKPLAERWGRRPGGRITLSWTLNPRTLDEVEPLIEEGWRRGFRNFNVKVAPDPDFDVELCRRVKRRVPDGFLWADANGGYDLETALAAAPRLAAAGVAVLEQPLRPNRLSGLRRLKQQGALPVILDEGVVAPEDLVEFHQLGLLDGVAMKPARCGGLLPARRQVEYLLEHGLLFLGSGLTDPDLSLAASLALYAAYGLDRPAALNGPQFLAGSSFLRRPLEPVGGTLEVPGGPGLGVEVDEAKLAALARPR